MRVEEMYRIAPFIIARLDEYSVVQNNLNITILTDERMVRFFLFLDEHKDYNVSSQMLGHYFGDDIDPATKFLLDNKLMEKVIEKNTQFNNVQIFSNDAIALESIKNNSLGVAYALQQNSLIDYDGFQDCCWNGKENDLFIFFLNPFNLKALAQITEKVRQHNLLSRMVFSYNNMVYFSNYYKREWYNPCPQCFFSHLESSLRCASKLQSGASFQTIMDLIYNRTPVFNVKNIITPYMAMPLVNEILSDLTISDNYNITGVKYYDFNQRRFIYDNAIHWELCDCYE